MILIQAIIKSVVADRVRNALRELGVDRLTQVSVQEFGAAPAHRESYRGTDYVVESVQRLQIGVVAPTEMESSVIEAIVSSSGAASAVDARVLVVPLGGETATSKAGAVRKVS